MEAIENAITYWEDALDVYRQKSTTGDNKAIALTSAEETEFIRDLQKILDTAYLLQRDCELLFLDQRSVLFRAESSVTGARSEGSRKTLSSWSSRDSFVSAQAEIADLRDLEEFSECPELDSLPFYYESVKRYEEAGILYRTLRTEDVRCSTDMEFLCKLHCIRQAFNFLMEKEITQRWFCDMGRQVLVDLMLYAEKDPGELIIAYEDMLNYINDPKNWNDMETELSERGVKALTFYDVALDLILMDAFDDLAFLPSSVTSVVQNKWLSDSFKEAALSTCLCSLLRAKRRLLKNPRGFMSHFYTISEYISPLLVWGFLGTDEQLRETCKYFREQVIVFLEDLFSFQKMRFTCVDDLSEDILSNLKLKVEELRSRLSSKCT